MSVSLGTKARFHVGALLIGDPIADSGAIFSLGSVPALAASITGVTIANNPVFTSTPSSGSWVVGDVVAITGFKGTTLGGVPDGIYTVTVGGATSFQVGPSVTTTGTFPSTGGVAALLSNRTTAANLVISLISLSAGVATITTTGAHNLSIGQAVGITALSGLSTLPASGTSGLNPVSQLAGPFVVSSSGFTTTTIQLNYASTGAPVLMTGTYVANAASLVPGPVLASPTTQRGVYSAQVSIAATLNAPGSANGTIAVAGVQVGDKVDMIPPTSLSKGITFAAWVSAPGVVSYNLTNGNGGAIYTTPSTWTLVWTKLVA